MFDRMEITESIYKGGVEPSYKKYTCAYVNRTGHNMNKRGESALFKTHPTTGESSGKHRK